MKRRPRRIAFAALALLFVRAGAAYERCGEEAGGGFCPTGNTCCPLLARSEVASSRQQEEATAIDTLPRSGNGGGCIPNDLGSHHAVCCLDHGGNNRTMLTGCGVGYTCSGNETCVASNESSITDPLVAVLPRYMLGRQVASPPPLHGFPVQEGDYRLAYYSSHGDITALSEGQRTALAIVLVVIHGANRNADDYFCVATSAVSLQQRYPSSAVLVIAPFFAGTENPEVELIDGGRPMKWSDGDGYGPWRYGADAVSNSTSNDGSLSSFHALDLLVSFFTSPKVDAASLDVSLARPWLPNLDRVVVAGHSSGGQFVQRWSLLTPVWDVNRGGRPLLHGVVANPSSYAYLTPLRRSEGDDSTSPPGQWHTPSRASCPDYNQWEWGLDPGGTLSNPYLDRQLDEVGGLPSLIRRFRRRPVTYLAGGQDRCNVSGIGKASAAWCDSHGLETTCRDLLQGATRWDRFRNYAAMVRWMDADGASRFAVVPGVGHDHSLLFQSDEGIRALFGSAFAVVESN